MATYAIGDVHGCFDSLEKLLKKMPFRAKKDRLWLVGDLVNRGPKSLEVLRWARKMERRMGERFQAVLGNHDLHLLAVAHGTSNTRSGDTLRPVLRAEDRNRLLRWLRQRPLLVRDSIGGEPVVMIHAGLPPAWSADKAERKAEMVQAMLDSRRRTALLGSQEESGSWWELPPRPTKIAKRRRDLAYLTRLRTCTRKGTPCSFSGPPEEAPKGCLPWIEVPDRQSTGVTVVFGHWAAMGLRMKPGIVALDSGCAWGNALSAVRLEDSKTFQVETVEKGLSS